MQYILAVLVVCTSDVQYIPTSYTCVCTSDVQYILAVLVVCTSDVQYILAVLVSVHLMCSIY